MSAFEKAKVTQEAMASEVDWAAGYEELLPRVYYYFCLRAGNRMDAEDLTAATFERAWRDRDRYRKDLGRFTNWLFGIAHHILISHYRKKQREHPSDLEEKIDNTSRSIEEDTAQKEQFERIVSVLESRPEREREVFSLKYGAKLTNRSISKMTGLTESNVGTILHRIVARLREELENENER